MAAEALRVRLGRLLRHWRSTQAAGRRAFPPATLDAIGAAIAAGERQHDAELMLVVEVALGTGALLRGTDMRQRARALFAEHGVWDTEGNCGVLVYVNLAERKVEIVADRDVGRRVDAAQWQAICQTMTAGYAHGDYHASTLAAIDQLNALLRQHYPSSGARENQLPDRPVLI